MRKKLIAGNWKMNAGYNDSEKLAKNIKEKTGKDILSAADVVLCPAFVSLGIVQKTIRDSGIRLGAQNLFYENDGPYTGEISASMLRSVGCEFVIIGHSERRIHFHETDKIINRKIRKAIEFDLRPILCVGETLVEREDEIFESIIEDQLKAGLCDISLEDFRRVIIAYEPVWAIGTGLNATPKQASEIHDFIRKVTSKLFDNDASDKLLVLYGGSVNGKNAEQMLAARGIDGALVGGASLKSDEFTDIVKVAAGV